MLAEKVYKQIEELVLEAVPEAFVVAIKLKRGKRNILSIKADTDKGISLEACASISRQVGRWLEEQDVFDFSYELQVSSPGVGTPLKLHRQYVQNVGRRLRVQLTDGTTLEGILEAVNQQALTLAPAPSGGKPGKKKKKTTSDGVSASRSVSFDDIKQSKVVL